MLLVEKVWTVEAGKALGRNGRTREIAVLMSCWAALRSVPSLNRTITSEAPWLEVDWTVSTPLTPSRALTMGTVTWASTISGDAPGSGVITITAGIEMSG